MPGDDMKKAYQGCVTREPRSLRHRATSGGNTHGNRRSASFSALRASAPPAEQ